MGFTNIVFDKSDPTVAWKVDHYNGVYLSIDEYRLDEERMPIEKRGVCEQGDDLLHGRFETIEEIEEKLDEITDEDELFGLIEEFNIIDNEEFDVFTKEEILELYHNDEHFKTKLAEALDEDYDEDSIKYRGASLEEKYDELGVDDFITYFYDNELDLAMGDEWEEVDDDDKELICNALIEFEDDDRDDDTAEPESN